MSTRIISIHCTRTGFRRYGHEFSKPATLAEVTEDGTPSHETDAELSLSPAQFADLHRWVQTENAVLSYSDPNDAVRRTSKLETQLKEMREELNRMERLKQTSADEIAQAHAARDAAVAESEEMARQLSEAQQMLADRKREAKRLEDDIDLKRKTLQEIEEQTEQRMSKLATRDRRNRNANR